MYIHKINIYVYIGIYGEIYTILDIFFISIHTYIQTYMCVYIHFKKTPYLHILISGINLIHHYTNHNGCLIMIMLLHLPIAPP